MTIALKYFVSVGTGHCEIDQFYADTLKEVRQRYRDDCPTREERTNTYCNVRTRNAFGNYIMSHCKPIKLQAFYKVEHI